MTHLVREAARQHDARLGDYLDAHPRILLSSTQECCFSNVPRIHQPFVTNPYVLGVSNGAVDLQSGELRGVRKEDYIYTCVPHAYDGGASTDRVQSAMEAACGGVEGACALRGVLNIVTLHNIASF